jgi:drug/metabolite transporter (DMT)-like permease
MSINYKINPLVYSTYIQVISALFALLAITLSGNNFIFLDEIRSSSIFLIVLLSCLGYTFGQNFRFQTLRKVEASQFTILFTTRILFTAILGYFILEERLSMGNVVGILLIISSIINLKLTDAHRKLKTFYFLPLLTALIFALSNVLDRRILQQVSPIHYLLLSFGGTGLLSFLISINKLAEYKKIFKKDIVIKTIFLAFLQFLSSFLFFKALSYTPSTTYVSAIVSLSTIFTTLLGILILKERKNTFKKILSAIIAFIGVILISVFNN